MKKFNLKEINKLIEQNNWSEICSNYKLPEWFIEKYQDKVNWIEICINQKLSDKFMIKHIDKITLNAIFSKSRLSKNFLKFLLFWVEHPDIKNIILLRLKTQEKEERVKRNFIYLFLGSITLILSPNLILRVMSSIILLIIGILNIIYEEI